MEYESDILKRLIKTYGVVGNPHYISEIIKEFIVQGKERFPELFTYQADWLAHIDEFGLNPSYTVSYTGQSFYVPNTLEKPVKSAILKGQTLVNLAPNSKVIFQKAWALAGSVCSLRSQNNRCCMEVDVKPNTIYTIYSNSETYIRESKEDYTVTKSTDVFTNGVRLITTLSETTKLLISFRKDSADTIYTEIEESYGNVVIEGDYTNVDIPYFEGMQSVKMPVLTTTGKNLFNNEFTTISNYNNQAYSKVNVNKFIDKNGNFTISILEELNSKGKIWFNLYINGTEKFNLIVKGATANKKYSFLLNEQNQVEFGVYSEGMSKQQALEIIKNDFKIQLEEGSTATPYEPYKSNTLTVNEDVELGSVGEVKDELNLLTGQLIQRTETRAYQEGDESNSEVITDMANTRYKLPKEVIKTVDLTILDQYGQNVRQLMSFNGGTHFNTKSLDGSPLPSISVSVETDLVETLKVCSLEGNTM